MRKKNLEGSRRGPIWDAIWAFTGRVLKMPISVEIVHLQTEIWTQDFSKTNMSGIRPNRILSLQFRLPKLSTNNLRTNQRPFTDHVLIFFSFVSSWLHLRVLVEKAEIETAQERLCNGSLPSRKGHSNMELTVINIVLAVQRVEMCAVTPKPRIRPHGAMYTISLFCPPSVITHSYRSHMVLRFLLPLNSISFWSFKFIFRALLTKMQKNTPIGFDMSVCPSAYNNSQPLFTNVCTFSQILLFSGRIIKEILPI
jgi:hypothetical protein